MLKDTRNHNNINGAFCWACKNGHSEIVEELLNDERVVPLLRAEGCQGVLWALCWACKNGHLKVVEKLLSSVEFLRLINVGVVIKALSWTNKGSRNKMIIQMLKELGVTIFKEPEYLYD